LWLGFDYLIGADKLLEPTQIVCRLFSDISGN
jgi:hypothetical protein